MPLFRRAAFVARWPQQRLVALRRRPLRRGLREGRLLPCGGAPLPLLAMVSLNLCFVAWPQPFVRPRLQRKGNVARGTRNSLNSKKTQLIIRRHLAQAGVFLLVVSAQRRVRRASCPRRFCPRRGRHFSLCSPRALAAVLPCGLRGLGKVAIGKLAATLLCVPSLAQGFRAK